MPASSIDLKALPPITFGCDYARLLQGVNEDGSKPTADSPSGFDATDTLAATVSLGQGLPSLFSPSVSWVSAPLAQVSLAISAAQSATLQPDALYLLTITGSRSGLATYPIVQAYLPVLPNAGAQAPAAPPDLVTVPYAGRLLGPLGLSEGQLEMIPSLISAVSAAFRSWANNGVLQGIFSEILPCELDGSIRLAHIPVNRIVRMQGFPQVAISIQNATADSAWVGQNSTGDRATGITVTGLTLTSQSGGVTTPVDVDYTANMTIAQLAAAVGAVGSGWSATADDVLGRLPVTELYDTGLAQGAGPDDRPDGGAQYRVFSSDLNAYYPHPDDGDLTGIYYTGLRSVRGGYRDAFLWGGYSGGGLGSTGGYGGTSIVKVTYDAGLASVPADLQACLIEMIKFQLERLNTDLVVTSERGGEYAYTIDNKLLAAMPTWVAETMSRYRISNA